MHDTERFYEDTLFVIVIYRSTLTESAAFQSLCLSGFHSPKDIFIYDNSPQPQIIPAQNERIHYYHNPENAGVSGAYNRAFDEARRLNKKWLMLADQDSRFKTEMLDRYAQSIRLYPDENIFAPLVMSNTKRISPFRLIGGKGIQIRARQPGIHFFRHLNVINSGLLISLTSFEAAGGYDNRFPLDFSDVVFIERVSKVTGRFVLIDAKLLHSLSSEGDGYNNTEMVLDRFDKFCNAAKVLKKTSNKMVIVSFILLPRAIKLMLIKRDIRFLLLALRTLIRK